MSVDTGIVFLPVETPYDQDVLFEYLGSIASAHRSVEVALERLRVVVSENGSRPHHCATCDRVMVHGAVRYEIACRGLCGRCARVLVREAEHELESPAERGEDGHHGGEDTDSAGPRDDLRL